MNYRGFEPQPTLYTLIRLLGLLVIIAIKMQVGKPDTLTQEDKVRVIAVFIFIIFGLFFWISSCGDEEESVQKILTPEEQRTKKVEKCFSGWDGSHRELTKIVKASMNDPDSYKHVETFYWDRDSVIYIKTTFRGSNAFGGIVKQTVSATTHPTDCYIIEIYDQ